MENANEGHGMSWKLMTSQEWELLGTLDKGGGCLRFFVT